MSTKIDGKNNPIKVAMLVQKSRSGDKEAFTELMELFKIDIYRTALSILRNEDDTADAFQESYIACFMNIHKLRNISYFKTWLIRIVINKSYNILKGKRDYVSLDELSDVLYNEEDEINAADEFSESILNKIDENYRLILSLFYVSGYSVKEISKITSLNENTIKTRLKRGRDKLKAVLDERDENDG